MFEEDCIISWTFWSTVCKSCLKLFATFPQLWKMIGKWDWKCESTCLKPHLTPVLLLRCVTSSELRRRLVTSRHLKHDRVRSLHAQCLWHRSHFTSCKCVLQNCDLWHPRVRLIEKIQHVYWFVGPMLKYTFYWNKPIRAVGLNNYKSVVFFNTNLLYFSTGLFGFQHAKKRYFFTSFKHPETSQKQCP